ncbi:MAG TPA: HDOD domain-containing protein [Polyangiaceae bacterium]|nr:HDOD domain-containing protein [Polyangiaceae bacterium]
MSVQASSFVLDQEPRPAWQQALIDEMLRTFAAEDYQPPLLPGAALQLLSLARDPDVAMSKVIGLLESEPLIVARVIRTAQSPMYSAGARIRTIEDAVLRLGTRAIALIFAEAAMHAAVFNSKMFQGPMQELRRHSTATAHVARKLAERIGQPGDRVYLCGLLHDIGIAACLLVAPNLRAHDGRPYDFETLAAPIYAMHEQAGEILSSLWNMPEGLRWVFAHHHQFALRTHVSPMAALVCLSSWIASEAGAASIAHDGGEQAALAARHFGWAEQLPQLVAFGSSLVAELGRGEA